MHVQHLSCHDFSEYEFFQMFRNFPPEVVMRLSGDLIENEDYDGLKTALSNYYTETRTSMFDKLCSNCVMTGRPSEFLLDLIRMGQQCDVENDFIRHKFIQYMPAHLKPIMTLQKSCTSTELGNIADELLAVAGQVNLFPARHPNL